MLSCFYIASLMPLIYTLKELHKNQDSLVQTNLKKDEDNKAVLIESVNNVLGRVERVSEVVSPERGLQRRMRYLVGQHSSYSSLSLEGDIVIVTGGGRIL